MEKIVEQALLYDFYGELLNEHQRKVYEDAIFNDLSFSEIADEYGISRQGVFDLIKRVNKTLANYESKLHLIEKFQETKTKVARIDSLADSSTFLSLKLFNEVYKVTRTKEIIMKEANNSIIVIPLLFNFIIL